MTQLAIAEEMAEPVSQSEQEPKRSEAAARRMTITNGKRPLLSHNAMPSEKPPSAISTNRDNIIYEEKQQGTQEDKKKLREEVARAEEEHLRELYRDMLFMLRPNEWGMWNSPDVGDALRSILCPSNAPSTLQRQLFYDSDDASTESSSAQDEGSSSETK